MLLTGLQGLHPSFSHNCSDVVLIVSQPVERKRCIVLQTCVIGGHQLQQRSQPSSLHRRHHNESKTCFEYGILHRVIPW
jgi:hypothetical protein